MGPWLLPWLQQIHQSYNFQLNFSIYHEFSPQNSIFLAFEKCCKHGCGEVLRITVFKFVDLWSKVTPKDNVIDSLLKNLITLQNNMEQYNVFNQKIVFLGAPRTGKSTIVKILVGKHNFTTKDYQMTQGVELHDKSFIIDGCTLNTVLVDTSGHELYRWLLKPICDENAFYALCFDLTNKNSVHALEAYIENFNIRKGALIGCKSDLIQRHVVSLSAVEEYADNLGLKMHVISIRTTTSEMEAIFRNAIMEHFRNVALESPFLSS